MAFISLSLSLPPLPPYPPFSPRFLSRNLNGVQSMTNKMLSRYIGCGVINLLLKHIVTGSVPLTGILLCYMLLQPRTDQNLVRYFGCTRKPGVICFIIIPANLSKIFTKSFCSRVSRSISFLSQSQRKRESQ